MNLYLTSMLLMMISLAASAASNDGYRLCRSGNPGCTAGGTIIAINSGTEVNEWCTCKILTNIHPTLDYFVPTKTEGEYRAFLNNLPGGISTSACLTNSGNGTYQITANTTALSVRGCNRVNGTLNGGGAGGGVRTSTTATAGVGGAGGRITLTNAALTATITSTITLTIGNGGEGGACTDGALGGSGGYVGGRGCIRSATSSVPNGGQVGGGASANGGAAGAESVGGDQIAGDGEYGGGGGGGDVNTGARNGGGGGGATLVTLDGVDMLVAGGGGGGGGTRGNVAAAIGGAGGNACNGTVNGAAGTNDNGNARAGPGGGGGACYSSLGGGEVYAASGGTGGAANAICAAGTGANGTVDIVFSRTTALP